MRTSVIIVNYNTQKITTECLESIFLQSDAAKFEIILVDNASTDGSAEFFQNYPGIKFVQAGDNIGFGRANNLGAKHATGEFLFFLNSDTIFKNDVIGNFETKFTELEKQKKNPGVIGTQMVDLELKNNSSYGRFETPMQEIVSIVRHMLKLNDPSKNSEKESGTFPVDWVTGADMYMKRSLFEEVGGFDPAFFMYHEEVDLQKRIHDLGYRNFIIKGPVLIHLEGASSAKKFTNRKRLMVDESRFIYYKKHTSAAGNKMYRVLYFLVRSPSLFNRSYTREENLAYFKNLLK